MPFIFIVVIALLSYVHFFSLPLLYFFPLNSSPLPIQTLQYAFDYHPEKDEVFACVADIGWITGHSYVVYGPLCNGGTTVLYESHPAHPDSGQYVHTISKSLSHMHKY